MHTEATPTHISANQLKSTSISPLSPRMAQAFSSRKNALGSYNLLLMLIILLLNLNIVKGDDVDDECDVNEEYESMSCDIINKIDRNCQVRNMGLEFTWNIESLRDLYEILGICTSHL